MIMKQLLACIAHKSSGGGAPTGHRYWRIANFVGAGSGGDFYIKQAEFVGPYGSFNAVNLADTVSGPGGTYLESSHVGSNVGSLAFDGNYDSAISNPWEVAVSGAWLGIDCGSGKTAIVDVVTLCADYNNYSGMPTGFEVEWSDDGSSWTNAWSAVTYIPWAKATHIQQFSNVAWSFPAWSVSPWGSHQYWQIAMLQNQGNTAFAFQEIQFYSGVTDTSTGVGTHFSTEAYATPTYDADQAFDGNSGTLWSASDGNTGQVLGINYGGSPVECSSVVLTSRSDGGNYPQCPNNFYVQSSDDGVHYTTAWHANSGVNYTSGSAQTFDAPAYSTPAPITLDPANKSTNVTLSGGDLIATASLTGSVLGTPSLAGGKYYFEFKMTFASTAATLTAVGFAASAFSTASAPGWDSYQSEAADNTNNVVENAGSKGPAFNAFAFVPTSGDWFGVAIDVVNSLAWYKDITQATDWNGSAPPDPVAEVGGYSMSGFDEGIPWKVVAGFTASGGAITMNFGDTAFAGVIPSGYTVIPRLPYLGI